MKVGILLTFLVFGASFSCAADVKAGPKDKCPICGMFVAKYPDFAAQIRFHDGSTFHFDGAKDMFKYYLNLPLYAPGKTAPDIKTMFVTSYYDLNLVDGRTAFFVVGSDIYGPMGHELIPFARESEARDFMKDHKGKAIVRFRDVTPAVLRPLD